MPHSIVADKSLEFAKNIITLYKKLNFDDKEYTMSKQILRSGTSIGANITEALKAQSKKDFLSKIYISLKETSETEYWLKLLSTAGYIESQESKKLLQDCQEISRILTAIIKTTKLNLKQKKKLV